MIRAKITLDDGWCHQFDIFVVANHTVEYVSESTLRLDETVLTFSDGVVIEKVEGTINAN